MKKNKLWFLLVVIIGIILIQPSNFDRIANLFMSQDIPEQLGITQSKVSGPTKVEKTDSEIISSLKKLDYTDNKMVIPVQSGKATFSAEDLSLSKGF